MLIADTRFRRQEAKLRRLSTRFPARLLPLLAAALLVSSCAVSVNPDRDSGGDGERHQSQPQELNKLFLDSIDFDSGDSTDWRYVLIGQRGIITLTCHFDNVVAKTRISIKDSVGNVMATQFHNGEPRQEATAKVLAGPLGQPARYYLEVGALEEGAISDYSCEAKFDPVVW
jgi:hypothetical protein